MKFIHNPPICINYTIYELYNKFLYTLFTTIVLYFLVRVNIYFIFHCDINLTLFKSFIFISLSSFPPVSTRKTFF